MKKALIDPTTQVQALTEWVPNTDTSSPQRYLPVFTTIVNSARVAEVMPQGSEFPVAAPLFWVDCADGVVADQWYYNTQTSEILVVPPPVPYPASAA